MATKAAQTFTSRSGVKIKIKTVPSSFVGLAQTKIREEMREQGYPLDPPVITLMTADGRTTRMQLFVDEEKGISNLENRSDPGQTAENQALWAAHENALEQLNAAQIAKMLEVYLSMGCEFAMPADLSEWEATLAFIDKPMPDNSIERKALYLTTAILQDDEMEKLIELILIDSQGASMSEQRRQLFRRQLRGGMERAEETRITQAAAAIRAMEDESEADRDADSESVGEDAE